MTSLLSLIAFYIKHIVKSKRTSHETEIESLFLTAKKFVVAILTEK